jgi:CRP/FNR family transcriptional regulator
MLQSIQDSQSLLSAVQRSGMLNDAEHQPSWAQSDLADIARYLHIPVTPQLQNSLEVFQHRHFKSGQTIFHEGDVCNTVYLINSGFTKSLTTGESGVEQIVNFQMKGDILGVDGMHARRHHCAAIALSECDLIVLPLQKMKSLGKTYPQFDMALMNLLSMELVFQQKRLCLLAGRNSVVRVANFLLNLSARFFQLGYSKSKFSLRMTRLDLGSYLGLSLETVSRSLSLLNESGLIEVNLRGIVIHDAAGLQSLSSGKPCSVKYFNGIDSI